MIMTETDVIDVPKIHGLIDYMLYEEIEKYIAEGGIKDVLNTAGATPLMRAAALGKIRLFKLFLDNGYTTAGTDNFGRGVDYWAQKRFDDLGRDDMLKLLAEKHRNTLGVSDHGDLNTTVNNLIDTVFNAKKSIQSDVRRFKI